MNKNVIKKPGFSLLEVLIAIAIVALIAVVSLPLFSLGLSNVKKAEVDSTDLFMLESTIELDNGQYIGDADIAIDFSEEAITIKVDFYEVKDDEGNVSIKYFKFKKDNAE